MEIKGVTTTGTVRQGIAKDVIGGIPTNASSVMAMAASEGPQKPLGGKTRALPMDTWLEGLPSADYDRVAPMWGTGRSIGLMGNLMKILAITNVSKRSPVAVELMG